MSEQDKEKEQDKDLGALNPAVRIFLVEDKSGPRFYRPDSR